MIETLRVDVDADADADADVENQRIAISTLSILKGNFQGGASRSPHV
jgi:hypothetical protein